MLIALLGLLAQAIWPGPTSGIITLNGSWRFRAGDDSAWAAPGFDDAGWQTLTVPGNWPRARGEAPGRYGWYRLRLVLGESSEPLALRFRSVATAFEAYLDGQRIGGVGGFPPHYRPRTVVPVVLALPPALQRPGEHLIAVRAYSDERIGGLVAAVDAGPLRALAAEERNGDLLLLGTALLLLGIGFSQITFWTRRPHALEHLLIFLFALSLALFFGSGMHAVRSAIEPAVYWIRPYLAFAAAAAAAFLFAFRRIFALDADRIVLSVAVWHLLLSVLVLLLPGWGRLTFVSKWMLNPSLLAAAAVALAIAVSQVRQGVRHARALLWGIAVLALALVHDIVADFGLLTTRPTSPWLIMVGSVAFMGSLAMTTAQKFADSESAALYDRLTGLYRREVVMDALQREIRRATRTGQPLSLIMLDVDRFKPINDTFGHQVGDRVLAEIGRRLGEAGRAVDWLCRYGGEEFLAVLSATGREQAKQAAQRLRSAVSALPIATGRSERTTTLSAGVATYESERREQWPTTEELVGAADAALYRAKNAGRDRVSD